jgi:hypothetical protein
MARGTPDYFTGSRLSVGDDTQTRNVITDIRTELNSYLSNGTNAWELYDTLNGTPPNEDYVYRSVGDRSLVAGAGDAALFFQIEQDSVDDIAFSMWQDWSTTANNGSRQAGSTSSRWLNIDPNAGYQYWGLVNEYEFVFLMKQAGAFHYLHIGSPIRSHIPTAANGIAFTTASAAAGASVTVNLDRDISANILDSGDANGPQQVWIYNLTPAGSALRSPTVEVAEVQTITGGGTPSITFTNLSNSFDSGAIVGLDPCPSFVTEEEILTPGGNVDLTLYFTNNVSGGFSSSTVQTADYESFLGSVSPLQPAPSVAGLLQGSRVAVNADQAGQTGYRGTMELIAFVFPGDLLDGDFFRANFQTASQYIVFPSIFFGAAGSISPALALGPGAS